MTAAFDLWTSDRSGNTISEREERGNQSITAFIGERDKKKKKEEATEGRGKKKNNKKTNLVAISALYNSAQTCRGMSASLHFSSPSVKHNSLEEQVLQPYLVAGRPMDKTHRVSHGKNSF